jgi:hypothetical protein
MPQPQPPRTYPRYFKQTLSTKRAQASGTRLTAPVAYLSDIRCCDVLPIDPTYEQEAMTLGASADFMVYCDPADIAPQDVLSVDGDSQEFTVTEVAKWPTTNTRVMEVKLRKYQ